MPPTTTTATGITTDADINPSDGLASRRRFLAGAVAAAGVALLDVRGLAAARAQAAALPPGDLFGLGVASGDPTADSVILWTRLLAPAGGDALPAADIAVEWEVASDVGFTSPVAAGTAPAVAALAHSVHADVSGLAPDTWYWYRFKVDGRTSPVGRTRTFPGTGQTPAAVRFALASCQNWADGYYTAHAGIAAEDIDFVVFVGDYIYEGSANRPPRPLTMPESKDIPSYRARYELYKSDPNLQASHARAPWIVTLDDHEVANNMIGDNGKGGALAGNPSAIAAWRQRRADAYQVWYEHLPLRLPAPSSPDLAIHRVVEHSDLLCLFVLDGRQYRSLYPGNQSQGQDSPARRDPARTMLGSTQEAWLDGQFAATGSTWNAIAQQTVMTAMPIPFFEYTVYNLDQWDGYVAARERFLTSLVTNDVPNPMVLSGDIHLAAAAAVRLDYSDPAAPDIAQEIVCTSISSRFDPNYLQMFQNAFGRIPWARYGNPIDRGYSLITLTADTWTTEFRVVDVTQPQATVRTDYVDVVTARAVTPTTTTTTTSTSTSTTTEPESTTTSNGATTTDASGTTTVPATTEATATSSPATTTTTTEPGPASTQVTVPPSTTTPSTAGPTSSPVPAPAPTPAPRPGGGGSTRPGGAPGAVPVRGGSNYTG